MSNSNIDVSMIHMLQNMGGSMANIASISGVNYHQS